MRNRPPRPLRLLAPALLTALLAAVPAHARRPPDCVVGRYLIEADQAPLADVTGGIGVRGVEVMRRAVRLDGLDGLGCTQARARMAVRSDGTTRVAAAWTRCGGARKLRLKAMVAPDCGQATLSLRAKRVARQTVTGRRSWCGDGRVDARGGERCDGARCASGAACTDTCGCDEAPPPGCDVDGFTSTWEAIRQRVLVEGGCTSAACHTGPNPTGGLDLSAPDALARLVDVPSQADPTLRRVLPGDAAASLLWQKLAEATLGEAGPDAPGSPMPVGLPPLPEDRVEAVRRWIRAGAPATGVVRDTAELLDGCLPPAGPIEMEAPPPPPAGQGVQLHAPPWTIAPHGENEVCYATYYDVSAAVPPGLVIPCPPALGGGGRQCFRWHRSEQVQDANSHHSIIYAYRGAAAPTDPGFGAWTCHGGARDGTACVPTGIGVDAPAGAECGPDSGCAGAAVSTVNCILYGPADFQQGLTQTAPNAPAIGGSQEPRSTHEFAAGVHDVLPVRGVIVWNSHAFNLFDTPATNEQWLNLWFASPEDSRWPVQPIFELNAIFGMYVPPFTTQRVCSTSWLPPGARLFELSSHTHKRGRWFRAWAPGVTDERQPPVLETTDYADPDVARFDPPLEIAPSTTTIQYCAEFDNGATVPEDVKRRSTSPEPPFGNLNPYGGPCDASATACLFGERHGQPCNGRDAACPGGTCDACPLTGGFTTEDEMFILTGSYYVPTP